MPCGAVQIFALGEKDSPLRALSNKAAKVLSQMLRSSGRGFGGYPMRWMDACFIVGVAAHGHSALMASNQSTLEEQ